MTIGGAAAPGIRQRAIWNCENGLGRIIALVGTSDYPRRMRVVALRLIAIFAVLLMTFGMGAPAVAAHRGETAVMPMEHCPEPGAKHDTNSALAECAMACFAALPAADLPSGERLTIVCAPAESAAERILHGLHLDIATPPPKRS